MKHIQIGILSADKEGREFLAKSWGKKGTTSDLSIWVTQDQEFLLTTILPEGYPKKVLSLVTTAHMSDEVVVAVSAKGLDATVGESAMLVDCLGMHGILAVLGTDTAGLNSYLDQMKKTFAKLSLANWKGIMISDGKGSQNARDILYNQFKSHEDKKDNYLAIDVDHSFPVQGVGSVILGTIKSGTIVKGQKITVYPSGQSGQVRSIQVNDEDVKEAGPGTHVGLAMKGILPKYLERGSVITSQGNTEVTEVETLEISIKKAAFGKPPTNGTKIHVMAGLFDTPAEIVEWGEKVSIKFDKITPFYPDMRITLLNLNTQPALIGSRKF